MALRALSGCATCSLQPKTCPRSKDNLTLSAHSRTDSIGPRAFAKAERKMQKTRNRLRAETEPEQHMAISGAVLHHPSNTVPKCMACSSISCQNNSWGPFIQHTSDKALFTFAPRHLQRDVPSSIKSRYGEVTRYPSSTGQADFDS
jgi:hypothetical protein